MSWHLIGKLFKSGSGVRRRQQQQQQNTIYLLYVIDIPSFVESFRMECQICAIVVVVIFHNFSTVIFE